MENTSKGNKQAFQHYKYKKQRYNKEHKLNTNVLIFCAKFVYKKMQLGVVLSFEIFCSIT